MTGTEFVAMLLMVPMVMSVPVIAAHPTNPLPYVLLVVFGFLLLRFLVRAAKGQQLRARTLGEMLGMTPTQFEQATATLLRDLGYRNVRRVGGSGDLCADIQCQDTEGRSVVVQCKRYAPGNRVGSPAIQTFIGMVTVHHRAERGIYVTTSDYTDPARALARRHGFDLLDGNDLARLVAQVQRKAA